MTLLLLTTEAAVVFGVSTYLLLRTWTRYRAVTMADVFFYDHADGARLPCSRSAGPRVLGEHVVAGFERSPLGAVIAAINLAHRATSTVGATGVGGVGGVGSFGGFGGAGGVGGAAGAVGGKPVPGGGSGPNGTSWYQVQIIGWEVERYSSRKAAIRYLLTRSVDGGDAVTTTMRVEVSWVGADWRVVDPPSGDWTHAFCLGDDVSGFSCFPSEFRFPVP
ncbi:hypothetical protein BBK14_24130 [Parafrankia soli]|uniref:DUF8175 domain-containing protein n=1 Tax=Parafrankia soli TaxID=2599596 RepID=A0A1S1PV23_9ACTN|nr:hypothetical protein [Parafrankia soli]OHV23774.1 hypothetical protein BBK14_24130 [Parafrankia soli]